MKVDLLKHNQEAYEKITEAITDGKKKIAIAHATGTGKSYLIAKLCEDYSNDKKLILVPSRYIKEQMQGLFEKYDIGNADIILYQKLIKKDREDIHAMDYHIIVLDEYHHDAATKVWGEKVGLLINSHPESIIFGTSATPVRTDGINAIDELFEGNCASDLPLSESIAKKIVPLPKYVGALYTLDDELERLRKKVENATNSKEEKKEFYKKINAMRSQIEKSYGMPIILNKHIKDKEGKYIVFCKNKKHLDEIKDTVIGWFHTAGCKDIHSYVVHSSYEGKDKEYKAFCDDTSHTLKLLFSVDMLNEGLHLENISGVLLLRPTRSSIVWHQQIGRAIEANNTNTPVIIDAVNNFSSVGQGMELLKEIKDAVAREKEVNPEFDDSGFEDIDTFFVVENVIEIKEMFREIEGRLQGSWDLYIKALKQYKEREGDCLVPPKHVEIVNDVNVSLGYWCLRLRNENNTKKGVCVLTEEMREELNKEGFIWDACKYRFENNIMAMVKYHETYGEYPKVSEKGIGSFILKEKKVIQKQDYPEWKKNIIEKYIPDFSWEYNSDKSFDKFIYYANMYKERYGHINIKCDDVIDGYNIGTKLCHLCSCNMSKDKIDMLNKMGIFIGSKFENRFSRKMELAKQAVEEGIIIRKTNPNYRDEDLYGWIASTVKRRYRNEDLTIEQMNTIEKLINKPLGTFFKENNLAVPTKVVDIINGKEIGIFKTRQRAAKYIKEKYGFNLWNNAIDLRLTGKVTTPYKGRFMFYYATDEEVKKYLEDDKAS